MLDFVSGEDIPLLIEFVVDGDFVTPDTGSVSYVVRGNSGDILLAPQAAQPTNNTLALTVPAALNAKALETENRAVVVNFKHGGQPGQIISRYRLIDWLNFTCTPADVRSQLGMSSTELPDRDISLVDAYLTLKADLATTYQTNLDAALSAGGLKATFANVAVVCQACHDLLGSLKLRAIKKEQDGTASYERFSTIDWQQLADDVNSRLEEAIQNLTGITPTYPSIFVVGARSDPITGA